VVELIDMLVSRDLSELAPRLARPIASPGTGPNSPSVHVQE